MRIRAVHRKGKGERETTRRLGKGKNVHSEGRGRECGKERWEEETERGNQVV